MKHHPQLARLISEAAPGTNFVAYDATCTRTKGQADTNNCVVRAISVACDLSMDEVTKEMSRQGGRKYGHGTLDKVWKPYLEGLKGTTKVWSKKFTDKQPPRLCDILERYPKGRFVLSMKKHLVAVIDGIVIDLAGLDINVEQQVYVAREDTYYNIRRRNSPVFAIWQVQA